MVSVSLGFSLTGTAATFSGRGVDLAVLPGTEASR